MCHHKNVTHDSLIKDAVKCEANMDPLERWRLILHGHTVCSCGTVHTSTILKVKSSLQTTRHLFVNLSGQYRYNLAHVHVAFFSSLKKYGSRCDVFSFLCKPTENWEKNRAETKSKKPTWDLSFLWSTCSPPWALYLCTLALLFVFICHHRAAWINAWHLTTYFTFYILKLLSISALGFIHVCFSF